MASLASSRSYRVQPCRGRGPAIELIPASKRLQENVLHEVMSFVSTAAESHAKPVQARPVLLEQATNRHVG
jgi:hypothetical protein